LRVGGAPFTKGLGTHANSEIRYALAGGAGHFRAEVGLDQEVGSNGSVRFEVWLDGNLLFQSAPMFGSAGSASVDVDGAGGSELRLVVDGGPDGINSDHADWADARLE
jgi:hypothetical protein